MMNLDEAAVSRLLRMEDVIPAMERALADFSSGKVVQPVRTIVPVAEHGGFFSLMPAYADGALGAKLVTFYPQNQGIHTHHATILLFKPETAELLVSMDGRLITEVRTAAVSAVATKYLARPDASVLAIIGSRVQARSHLEALRLVRDFEDVRVWSPRNAGAFATRFDVRATVSAEEAVRGADVVVVATTSKTPVLSGEWLSSGAHVNAVGAPRLDWRELDDDVMRRARIYVDSHEAAFKESGDVIAAGEAFAGVGEVVVGTKPGRESLEEITLFKSLGLAVEDVATASLIRRRALIPPPPRTRTSSHELSKGGHDGLRSVVLVVLDGRRLQRHRRGLVRPDRRLPPLWQGWEGRAHRLPQFLQQPHIAPRLPSRTLQDADYCPDGL